MNDLPPWVCPPCRRGAHKGCMDVPSAPEPVCHCNAGHVVTESARAEISAARDGDVSGRDAS